MYPQGTYAPPRYLLPIQVRTGEGTPRYLPPSPPRYLPPIKVRMGEGGTLRYFPPSAKVATPPPRDRTAYGVLDMLRSVCLLRSYRRTFLWQRCSHVRILDQSHQSIRFRKKPTFPHPHRSCNELSQTKSIRIFSVINHFERENKSEKDPQLYTLYFINPIFHGKPYCLEKKLTNLK